jgi:hypothetical protein
MILNLETSMYMCTWAWVHVQVQRLFLLPPPPSPGCLIETHMVENSPSDLRMEVSSSQQHIPSPTCNACEDLALERNRCCDLPSERWWSGSFTACWHTRVEKSLGLSLNSSQLGHWKQAAASLRAALFFPQTHHHFVSCAVCYGIGQSESSESI